MVIFEEHVRRIDLREILALTYQVFATAIVETWLFMRIIVYYLKTLWRILYALTIRHSVLY